jgi:hypothetical protein
MRATNLPTTRTHFSESALLAFFSAVALLIHLLTNGRYGYVRDELYYLVSGRHLDFGYVDQPPLSILLRLSELLVVFRVEHQNDFEDLGQVVSSPWAMPFEQRMHIFLCRDLKISVRELWPRVKKWL